jgi:Mrp family chromosome partitioning ATPase/capsular polysaccharide biosynthesis protein
LLALLIVAIAVLVGVVLLQQAPKTYDASTDVAADLAVPTSAGAEGSAELVRLRDGLVAAAGSAGVADDVSDQLSVPRAADVVRRAVRATWVPGTTLLHLTAEDPDPAVAAEIANATALALPRQAAADAFVLTTIQRAQPPTRWSSPDPLLSLGGVALGAVLLAAAGALWRDRRDRPVDDGAGVEEATSAPLLAHLSAPADPTELPALDPGSADAAVFRRLRESLADGAGSAGPGRVVVAGVSAAGPGADDGVWLGANLAISLADEGRRVLLVDGRLGERFGTRGPDEPDTPGLYDVLRGTPLDHALSPGPTAGLTVLPSGAWGVEQPERLVGSRFGQVMAGATQRFDVVVVLGPPLESSDDARTMAAGGSLLLAVGEDEVTAHELRAHADRLRSAGTRLLGTVLVGRAGSEDRPRVTSS